MDKDGQKILLVEDEYSVRRTCQIILRDAGYNVITAKDGDEALDILAKDDDFSCILTDIVMPGILSTKDYFSKLDSYDIPIISMTAQADDEKIPHVISCSSLYLKTNLNPDILVDIVTDTVKKGNIGQDMRIFKLFTEATRSSADQSRYARNIFLSDNDNKSMAATCLHTLMTKKIKGGGLERLTESCSDGIVKISLDNAAIKRGIPTEVNQWQEDYLASINNPDIKINLNKFLSETYTLDAGGEEIVYFVTQFIKGHGLEKVLKNLSGNDSKNEKIITKVLSQVARFQKNFPSIYASSPKNVIEQYKNRLRLSLNLRPDIAEACLNEYDSFKKDDKKFVRYRDSNPRNFGFQTNLSLDSLCKNLEMMGDIELDSFFEEKFYHFDTGMGNSHLLVDFFQLHDCYEAAVSGILKIADLDNPMLNTFIGEHGLNIEDFSSSEINLMGFYRSFRMMSLYRDKYSKKNDAEHKMGFISGSDHRARRTYNSISESYSRVRAGKYLMAIIDEGHNTGKVTDEQYNLVHNTRFVKQHDFPDPTDIYKKAMLLFYAINSQKRSSSNI